MFKSSMKFTGKHAQYLRELAPSKRIGDNYKPRPTPFEANLAVVKVAPLIGFLYGRKADQDYTKGIEDNSIFLEQVIKIRSDLEFVYRLIMLLDDKDSYSSDLRLDKAFKYDNMDKERSIGDAVFNQYMLGGIEVLHEKLVDGVETWDDLIMHISDFCFDFETTYCKDYSLATVEQLCNEASI